MATKNYVLGLTYDATGLKLVDSDLSGSRSFDNDAAGLYDDGQQAILPGDNKVLLVSDMNQLHMFDLDGSLLWTVNPDINRFDFDFRKAVKGDVAGHFFLLMQKATNVVGSPDYVFPVPADMTKLVFEKRSLADGSLVSTAEIHADLYDGTNFVNYVEGGSQHASFVARGNFVYFTTAASTPTIGKTVVKVDVRDGTYSVVSVLDTGMTSVSGGNFLDDTDLVASPTKKVLFYSAQTDAVDNKDAISVINPADDTVSTTSFLQSTTDAGELSSITGNTVFIDFTGGKVVFVGGSNGNAFSEIPFATGVKPAAVAFASPYDVNPVDTSIGKACFMESGAKLFTTVNGMLMIVLDVATGALAYGPLNLPWGSQSQLDGTGRRDGNDLNKVFYAEGLQTYTLSGTVSVSAAAAVKRVELHDQATGYKITAKNSEADGTIAFECLSPRKKSAVCESPNATTEFQVRNELVPTATA